ncbi:MAG TPA: hypothetical protein VGH91_04645 [Gammaproteobacteria bacterium]|jgi:hypothetical protein
MKTAVRDTSIETYYASILAPGVELSQANRIVAYVLSHPCCTRREIAAHFKALNADDPLGQEARVSARVNALLKRRWHGQTLVMESDAAVTDAKTGERAYPLYPSNYGRQKALFPQTEARPAP